MQQSSKTQVFQTLTILILFFTTGNREQSMGLLYVAPKLLEITETLHHLAKNG